jgi:hypothetical protein
MKYAADGVHSKNYTFKFKDRQNNTERDITVYDYFQERYNIRLQFPMLPLLPCGKSEISIQAVA